MMTSAVHMGHLLEFDRNSKIIRVTVEGEFTDLTAAALYADVQRFIATEEVHGGILDLSPITSLAVSGEVVERLAKNPRLFGESQVRVIVAPRDLLFGMARLFQIYRSEIHSALHVVHTLDEAYAVHNIQSPQFSAVDGR
jgi:hypothetical protein